MIWSDYGYLLSKNKFGENSMIAEFFTENHGKISGIIYGATSKKIRNYLVNKYPEASSMSLTVNLKSINKYGEDQKRSLGVCEMNSKDVRNLRRYTSAAMYNYSDDSAQDCLEVTMQLFY